MSNEIKSKVEEIKQDADVKRALKQATPKETEPAPATRIRDKLVIGTHILMLIGLGVVHQVIDLKFPAVYVEYPLIKKLIIAVAVAVMCLMVLRLIEVFFIGRVANAVYKYNLNRVARLVVWLVIGFFVLTILFQNCYTAVVSFGLISLVLGFAIDQEPAETIECRAGSRDVSQQQRAAKVRNLSPGLVSKSVLTDWRKHG